jgi:hypothetical protein
VSFCCPLVVVGSLAGGTQRWDSCPTSQVSFLQLRPQARALCVCVCVYSLLESKGDGRGASKGKQRRIGDRSQASKHVRRLVPEVSLCFRCGLFSPVLGARRNPRNTTGSQ